MDYKKLFLDYVAKSLNRTPQDLSSVINEEDEGGTLSAFLEMESQKVTKLIEPIAGKQQEWESSGISKRMKGVNKFLKQEYGIEPGDAPIEDVIKNLVVTKVAEADKSGQITDEKVQLHPKYQALEKTVNDKVKQVDTEWEEKYNKRENDYKKDNAVSTISAKMRKRRQELGVIIPEDAEVADNIEASVVDRIKAHDYLEQDDSYIPTKDGKPLDNGQGFTLGLEPFLDKTIRSFYVLPKNNGGTTAGNGKQTATTTTATQGRKFSNDQEYQAIMQDKTVSPEEKRATYDTWKAQQQPVQ